MTRRQLRSAVTGTIVPPLAAAVVVAADRLVFPHHPVSWRHGAFLIGGMPVGGVVGFFARLGRAA